MNAPNRAVRRIASSRRGTTGKDALVYPRTPVVLAPATICAFVTGRRLVQSLAAMKMLRFVPLTFLCGAHGFALFAPYLAAFLAASHYLRRRRQLSAAAVPVSVIPISRT